MSWTGILSWLAFIGVMTGLLFLSLIHLFMIPKDVMKRDLERQLELEGDYEEDLRQQEQGTDAVIADADHGEKNN